MASRRKKGRYENQKTKGTGGIFLVLLLLCAVAGSLLYIFLINRNDELQNIVPTEPATETTVHIDSYFTAEDHYAPVLEKYRLCLDEGWTKEQCEIEDISIRFSYTDHARANSSYQLLDLNGDSREELLICSMAAVWDLYTLLEDGTPVHLHTDELDGTVCFVYKGGIIGIELTTKTDAEYCYYRLEDNQLVVEEMIRYTDSNGEWSREAGEQEWEVISREAASDIMYGYEPMALMTVGFVDEFDDSDAYRNTIELYMLVLEKYKTALLEKWDFEQCSDNGICYMTAWLADNPQDLGACFMDLDEDGVLELLIVNDTTIYDLYTLKNGNPVLVLSGGERNYFGLWPDNSIINHGSGSAFWSVFNRYQLQHGSLILLESVISDYQADPENPWFRSPDGETLGEPMTQAQADAIRKGDNPIAFIATPVLELN